MAFARLFRSKTYTVVPTEDRSAQEYHEDCEERWADRRAPLSIKHVVSISLALMLAFIAGFLVARIHSNQMISPAWLSSVDRVAIGVMKKTFHYNRTFAVAPSPDDATEVAWDSIIPQGQGFVQYSTSLAAHSAISGVHQLHCLYSIRRAYFASTENRTQETMLPPHMRHCFDYLRQSLMCSADSTLDPVVPKLGGASGWDFPRQCNDWEELKLFAEKWRTNDRKGFREGIFPGH